MDGAVLGDLQKPRPLFRGERAGEFDLAFDPVDLIRKHAQVIESMHEKVA